MATRRPTGISAPNGDIWEFQDAKVGDLTQTGVTGATVAAQISQLNDEIGVINSRLTSTNSFRIGSIIGSSGTLVQQCVAFALNIKNTYGIINAFEGMFYYSGSSRPSDVPANETTWTYASGKFLIRTVDGNNNVDATIILFAYAASKIAIKTIGNSAQASDWVILGS